MTVDAVTAPSGTRFRPDAAVATEPETTARRQADEPRRRPAAVRPAWWMQIVLILAFAEGYDGIRAMHGDVVAIAVRHGYNLLHLDEFLHVSWGPTLDAWLVVHGAFARGLSGYYAVMHLGMTSTALVVLWFHGQRYRRERNILIGLSTVGLVVYWFYPTAPPRLLPGGPVDVVAQHLPFATSVEVSNANLYASMPSLHVAWALWASIALWPLSRRVWIRSLLVGHSVVTTITVLATGNHYTIDVVCGAALTVGTYAAVAVVARVRAVMDRTPEPAAVLARTRAAVAARAAQPVPMPHASTGGRPGLDRVHGADLLPVLTNRSRGGCPAAR